MSSTVEELLDAKEAAASGEEPDDSPDTGTDEGKPAGDDTEGVSGEAAEDTEDAGGGSGKPEGDAEPDEGEFVLKVDGEELKKSREEVIRLAQKGLAADKRMEQASEGVKKAKEAEKALAEAKELHEHAVYFRDQLLQDPLGVARQLLMAQGYDEEAVFNELYKYTESAFAGMLDLKQKPEVRKASWAEEELKRTRAENERLRKERESREEEEKIQAAYDNAISEIKEALGDADLPQDEDDIIEIAGILVTAEKEGETLTAEEAVDRLKAKLTQRRGRLLEELTYEELKKRPELLKQIREADLAELKQRSQGNAARTTPAKGAPATKAPKRRRKSKDKDWKSIFGDPFE